MPYDAHVTITCSGRLGATAPGYERFSFGLSYAAPAGLTNSQLLAMNSAITTFFGAAGASISSVAVLEQIKYATRAAGDGHYTTVPNVYVVAQAGAGTLQPYPSQVSWVVTYENKPAAGTALTPSRRRRGRFYLPAPVASFSVTSGLIASSAPTTLATTAQTLINSLNTAGGGQVVVASGVDGNHVVNQVRVGNRLDIQRSRAKQMVETYVAASIP